MTTKGNPPLFYLPLGQTVYQKSLVDILIQLHRPHILAHLKKQADSNGSENDSSSTSEISCKPNDATPALSSEGTMGDQSMVDAFIFNVKQITNHPTLLVDHYIPRNLLLLNSKENIISLSNKYHQISEMLDKLVERDIRKTIVISVSNAKEMDLIESFLLGKRGLQYYRFSGSSLYYDNHGSFDFHKESESSETRVNNQSLASSDGSVANPGEIPKRKYGRSASKKNNANGNGTNGNGYDYDASNPPKKKKGGRPSTAEKRAREQHAQVTAAIAAVTSAESSNGENKDSATSKDGSKVRANREEYIPKLSKNNEEFVKMLEEKKSKKLNVYLILSSQLKYLLQFEDLKSDLIVSLDSNFTDFEDLSSILNHQVPILKPIILESLEHYEWEMNSNNDIVYNDDHKRNKSRRSRNDSVAGATTGNSKSKTPEEKAKFNRLLVLLAIAASSNVEVELPSTIQPISNNIIDWLVDPVKHAYPFPQTIGTQVPHVMDDSLIDKVKETLSSSFELSNVLGINKLDHYSFFNEELNTQKLDGNVKIEHDSKRIKLSPSVDLKISEVFTYRQYQSNLTNLINDTLQEMINWMDKTRKELDFVHLDETERQFVIDEGNFQCGELFKKDRDLGVKIEARGKAKEKLVSDFEKLDKIRSSVDTDKKGLKERYEEYSSPTDAELNFDKQDAEIKALKERLDKLQVSITESEGKSDDIRKKYQEVSSGAAELSALVKKLESHGKTLEEESKGTFKKIQIQSIVEKRVFMDSKVTQLDNDYQSWKGYLEILQIELEKRNNGIAPNPRVSRNSRNNTPH